MFLTLLAIVLFALPGLVSEFYYLRLIDGAFADNRLGSMVRALSFSMAILLIRCMISLSRGYGDLSVQDLFFEIGNVGKYILLSAVMSLLMPNAYLLVDHVLLKKRGEKK